MKNSNLKLLMRTAVSLLILGYFFGKVEINKERILSIFSQLSLAQITLAFVFLCFTVVFQIARWQVVTKGLGYDVARTDIINIFFGATFSGLVLPSSMGGDAIRMIALKKYGLSPLQAIGSVAIDRVAGLLSLLWLVLFIHTGFYMYGIRAPIVVGGLILSIATFCGIGLSFFILRYESKFSNLTLIGMAFSLVRDFKAVNFSRHPGVLTCLLSMAIQIFCSVSIYFIANALGLPIALWVTVALVPVVMLATAIPISIAGWGVREGAMVMALAVVGVPAENALITSLVFGVLLMLMGLICGIFWLCGFDWGTSIADR